MKRESGEIPLQFIPYCDRDEPRFKSLSDNAREGVGSRMSESQETCLITKIFTQLPG